MSPPASQTRGLLAQLCGYAPLRSLAQGFACPGRVCVLSYTHMDRTRGHPLTPLGVRSRDVVRPPDECTFVTGCRHRHKTAFPLGVTPRGPGHDRGRGSYPRAQITTGPTEGGVMVLRAATAPAVDGATTLHKGKRSDSGRLSPPEPDPPRRCAGDGCVGVAVGHC